MKRYHRVSGAVLLASSVLLTSCAAAADDESSTDRPTTELTTLYPAPEGGNGGATAPGVTEDTISTATVYSGAAAASNNTEGVLRGVQAYYAYVNANGGVFGRELETTGIDDGLDAAKAQSGCTNAADDVFAFVGSLSLVDTGCYPVVSQNSIPWVGMKLDPVWADYPGWRDWETGPPQTLAQGPYQRYADANPEATKVAILWNNAPGLDTVSEYWANTWESVGIEVVYNVGINVPVNNYTPYVIAAREAGADIVDTSTMDVTNASRVAQAMSQQGWEPELKVGYVAYQPQWQELTGEAGVGWHAYLDTLPYQSDEELTATEGGRLFLEWWHEVHGADADPDVYDLFGWVNAALFVEGLAGAGPELSRDGMLGGIDALESFDAAGLIGEQQAPIGARNSNACFIEVVTTSATEPAERVHPEDGFDCSNQTLITLDGAVEN